MSITIKQITDKQTWEGFIKTFTLAPFLQSWYNGELNESLGEKSYRLGIYEGEELKGLAYFTLIKAKRGTFLFCPYGPLLKNWEHFKVLVEYLKKFGEENKVDFIRISPFIEDNQKNQEFLKKNGFKKAPIHMLGETLWLLDLEKSEDELLMGMRKTHRNLIRRAIKENVEITKSDSEELVEEFMKLHGETVKRHHFVPYPDALFRNQVKFFRECQAALVFLGKHQNQTLASAIVMYYGGQGAYHHGASHTTKIPVSYLMQWEAIKEAKKRGYKLYNFWGIAPPDAPKDHPFKGITLFKTGFGGRQYDLLPCHDLPLTFKYNLTRVIETLRKKKRGF